MKGDRFRAWMNRQWLSAWLPSARRPLLRPIDAYVDWCSWNELTQVTAAGLAQELEKNRPSLPSISVIMPVYKPQQDLFLAAVKSVRAQLYQNWELCICNDASGDPALDDLLTELALSDERIRLTALEQNSGISTATNAAAALATGDVLLFLDQDDLIAYDCLAEFALAFARDASVDLAFSDSDKIDRAGKRKSPAFKPGWSPTLLLSHMYVGHAIAVKASLFRELGGMRQAFDGSQDYDFMLRASERARSIRHVPHVLYHWRVLEGSTALSAGEKPHSISAGQAAVAAALDRRNITASVNYPDWAERAGIGLFELGFAAPMLPFDVVLLAPDRSPIDANWLTLVSKTLPKSSRIVLTGDLAGSMAPDCSLEIIAVEHGRIGSFAERVAQALRHTTCEHIVFLHAGALPARDDWCAQLLGHASLPSVGAAGGRVTGRDGRIANAGFVLPSGSDRLEPAFEGLAQHRPGTMYLARTARECIATSAACMAVNRVCLSQLGPIPDHVIDADVLGVWISGHVRARNQTVVCCPGAQVMADSTAQPLPQSHATDPWYNRNLGAGEKRFKPARRTSPLDTGKPMVVAAVTHNLDREGAQTLLVDLLCELKLANLIAPVMISPKAGELSQRLADHQIPVIQLTAKSRRISVNDLERRIDELVAIFREVGADVVLANTLEMYAAIEAAQRAGVGSIWWQHEGGSWRQYFKPLRRGVRARALAALSLPYRVVQVCESTRQKWLPASVRDNFEVIRHGIPPQQIERQQARWTRAAARTELGLSASDFCIVLVGSVSARKGQLDSIEAFAHLPNAVAANTRLMVVGAVVEPRYGKRIDATIARMPTDRRTQVTMVGRVTDTALYYRAADAFACCSRQESAPLAIIEAMAFGLPIVSTPVDGIPELVEFGVNGVAYEPGDVATLAGHLEELATSPERLVWLQQQSQRLSRYANNYDRMIERFTSLLRETAKMRRFYPSLDE